MTRPRHPLTEPRDWCRANDVAHILCPHLAALQSFAAKYPPAQPQLEAALVGWDERSTIFLASVAIPEPTETSP